MDTTLPAPTLDHRAIIADEVDRQLVRDIVTSGGGTLVDAQREALAVKVAERRVPELRQLQTAYAYVLLYLGDLKALIKRVGDGALPSPHGNEPRSLVYRRELTALVAEAENPAFAPTLVEAEKLSNEIEALRKVGRHVASGRATLTRLRVDLRAARELSPEQQIHALDAILGHLDAELADPIAPVIDRSEQALTDSYYPITERTVSKLLPGDVLFDRVTRKLVHEVGVVPPMLDDNAVFVRLAPPKDEAEVSTVVVLRPVGRQAVIALRLRAVAGRLQSLAQIEEKLATRYPKEAHLGRAQGMNVAYEMLTGPSWALPAAVMRPTGDATTS